MPNLSAWEQMALAEQDPEAMQDPQLQAQLAQLQAMGAMNTPENALLEEELAAEQAMMQMPPSAEARAPMAEEMAALSQAKQAQLAQRIGNEDELTTMINRYKQEPVQMDYSGLLALADAWGPDKSNFVGAYRKPMSREEKNLKVMELQDLLQKRREEAARGQREQLKLALMARKQSEINPLKAEEQKWRTAMYKAQATGRAQNLEQVKDSEALAAGYGRRMEQSENVFNQLEKSGFSRANTGAAFQAMLPGAIQGEKTKQQEQAERNFINAVLRRESGAAISESEYKSAEQQYFPRVGDDPQTLENKRANRLQAIESMKVAAGRAWEKTPLVSPKAASGLQSFQDKQKRLLELQRKAGQ